MNVFKLLDFIFQTKLSKKIPGNVNDTKINNKYMDKENVSGTSAGEVLRFDRWVF